MHAFEYHHTSLEEQERLASEFCDQHGDGPHGAISESEYVRLFDHFAAVLSSYGTFAEACSDADFSGSRYVDQIPWITIVSGEVSPCVALSAALQTIASSHRPFAISFDYYPEGLLILPSNKVYTTFAEDKLGSSS